MSHFSNHTLFSSKDSIHRSFIEAMMSGLVSDLVFKGIHGSPHANFDFFDLSLAAFQSGVSEVSYRVAIETIACFSKNFKKVKDDPQNKSQTIVYLTGGSLGALYATGINYPIDCIREFRNNNNKEFKMNFQEAEKFYADKAFNYIGYATSMGNIVPLLPKSTNNFNNHFVIQMSHLNGILTAYPSKIIKKNSEFLPYIKRCVKSCAVKRISSGLLSNFQKGIDHIRYISF